MGRIAELLAKGLENLTTDELAELDQLRIEEAARLADEEHTDENVADLGTLADVSDQLRGEQTRRDEQAAAREQAVADALARINPVATETAPEGDLPAEGEDLQPGQTPDGVVPAPETPAGDRQPEAVAAAAARRPGMGELNARRPAARTAPRIPEGSPAPRSRLRAAANLSGFVAGQEITTPEQLTEATIAALRGGGGHTFVAQAQYDFPEDRRLGADGPANERRIRAVTGPDALVAAGGLCAPVENVYDVPVIGSPDRPLRDSLPSFNASRGGVNLRGPSQFTDLSAGVGTWTLAQDATPGTDTKPVVDAICAPFEDWFVDATTLRVRFSNVTSRFDPEMTRANNDLADIAYAKYAENKLLGQIRAFLTPVTTPKVVGATRDILASLDRVIAYFRSRHRLNDVVRLRAVLPQWVKDLIRADLTRALHTSNLEALAVTDQQIMAWFDRRNVNVTFVLDGRETAQSAGGSGGTAVPAIGAQVFPAATRAAAIPEFPDTLEWLLFMEGDVLYLDAGELDLGVVRDSTLNAQNRYEMFREEFNGAAWRGIEGLQIVSTVDPTGGSAGTVDTSAVSD